MGIYDKFRSLYDTLTANSISMILFHSRISILFILQEWFLIDNFINLIVPLLSINLGHML